MSPGNFAIIMMLVEKLGGQAEISMEEYHDLYMDSMDGKVELEQYEDHVNRKWVFKVRRKPETVDGEVVEEEVRSIEGRRVEEAG